MTAVIIGIFSGLLVVLLSLTILNSLEKPALYSLILSGIGFLYVGFTWTDISSLVITCVQAVVFLFLAYYGAKKNLSFLGVGYFMHGLWDLAYGHFDVPKLIPPHYDLFCLSIDFTIGLYLVLVRNTQGFQKALRNDGAPLA